MLRQSHARAQARLTPAITHAPVHDWAACQQEVQAVTIRLWDVVAESAQQLGGSVNRHSQQVAGDLAQLLSQKEKLGLGWISKVQAL